MERHDEDRYIAMAQLLVAHGRTGPANRVVRRALAMLEQFGVASSPGCPGWVKALLGRPGVDVATSVEDVLRIVGGLVEERTAVGDALRLVYA